MQVYLFGMALTALLCVIAFLPETSHPGSRGIDKLSNQEDNNGFSPRKTSSKWKWVWLNPVKSLAVLRGPNILFVVRIILQVYNTTMPHYDDNDRSLLERLY